MHVMTDDETYAAICADFPFDSAALAALHARLENLKTRINSCTADGTIDKVNRLRIFILTAAIRDLRDAMVMVENDGDPEEFIPF